MDNITPSRNKSLIESVTTGMRSTDGKMYYEITPELAQRIVDERMTRNRVPSEGKIASYVDSMKKGEWSPNVARIMFVDEPNTDDHGMLVDGQHRLLAQSRAGVTLWWLIGTCTKEEAKYIDIGRPRTVASNIAMFVTGGEDFDIFAPIAYHVHAIARTVCSGKAYQHNVLKSLAPAEIVAIWAGIEQSVRHVSDRGVRPTLSGNVVRAFLATLIIGGCSTKKAHFRQFAEAVSQPVADATITKIIDDHKKLVGKSGHDNNRPTFFTLIRLWNYIATGIDSKTDHIPRGIDLDNIAKVLHITQKVPKSA